MIYRSECTSKTLRGSDKTRTVRKFSSRAIWWLVTRLSALGWLEFPKTCNDSTTAFRLLGMNTSTGQNQVDLEPPPHHISLPIANNALLLSLSLHWNCTDFFLLFFFFLRFPPCSSKKKLLLHRLLQLPKTQPPELGHLQNCLNLR